MDEDRTVGDQARRYRRRAGLTQEELAVKAGLSARTIRDLESGRVRHPRGPSLRLLAGALGVDIADLAGAAPLSSGLGSQLPADDADFTGRVPARDRLTGLLAPGHRTVGVPVAVVTGRPGVGKTALAVHVAHLLRDRFPDGQLYARIGGDVPLDPAEVLGRFLRALGLDGSSVPPTLDERAADFRARLTDRRVLVVLDDAATEAQVRPLLPGTEGCAALITSRSPLSGLLGAGPVALDLLDHEQSLALLGRVAGTDRVGAEPAAADRVAVACGGLPLALRIAAARSVTTPVLPLAELAALLDDESRRLDELSLGDVAVRASFGIGYRQQDGTARRAYRLLGLLRTADVPAWAVAALLDTDGSTARAAADRLVAARLLDRHGAGPATRYRMHDLVRLDARDRARAEDLAADRREAVRRALSGWLGLAAEADRRLPSDTMPLPDPVPAGWRADPATTSALLAEPLEWFEAERPALREAVRQAAAEAPELTAGLVDSLIDFLATRHYPDDWIAVAGELRRSAEATGDGRLTGHALRRLAEGELFRRTDLDAAESLARAAVAAGAAAGDIGGAGAARLQLASALRISGRYDDAVPEAERARDELAAAGDPAGVAHADVELAGALFRAGRHADSGRRFSAAEEVLRRTGDLRGCGMAWTGLAMVRGREGDPGAALACARQALTLFEQIGDRRLSASTQAQIGHLFLDLGQTAAAIGPFRSALAAGEELEALEVLGLGWYGMGEVHRRLGEPDAARTAFGTGAELLERVQLPGWQGRAEYGLGRVAIDTGDQAAGRRHWERAARLFETVRSPRADTVRAELAALPA